MNAEFNWWLLIVGLVAGAGLVWLVIADWGRREQDMAEDEIAVESAWIAQVLRERGEHLDPQAAEEILLLHRSYLRETGVLQFAMANDAAGTGALGWSGADGGAGPMTHHMAYTEPTPEARSGGASSRDAQRDADDAFDAISPVRRRSVRETPLAPRGGPPIDEVDEPPGG
jgi:hypothetical protein